MTMRDLYSIAKTCKRICVNEQDNPCSDIEISMRIEKGNLENIDKELFEMTNGTTKGFKHKEVVTVMVNGIKFTLMEGE